MTIQRILTLMLLSLTIPMIATAATPPDLVLNDQVDGLQSPLLKGALPPGLTSYAEHYAGTYAGSDKTLSGDVLPTDINQYMIGSISVTVVLPESIGGSEDWTDEEIAEVHSQITTGLAWWGMMEPAAGLDFHFTFHDRVAIEDEPITQNGMDWWLLHTITALGYQGEYGIWVDSLVDMVNDERIEQETDWGFIIFVVDSSNDADGSFADDYSAFVASFGTDGMNPFMIMTYDNGYWGIDDMNNIAAHEMGHIFGAQDQYAASGCGCDDHTGYLYAENQNCANDCLIDDLSIMKNQATGYANNSLDVYAQGQIGWRDSDADGVLDIVDTVPSLSFGFLESPSSLRFRFSGSAEVDLLPAVNPYYHDSNVNTIAAVEYRVDGGPWLAAAADDGAFDSPQEAYLIDVTIEGGANRLLECRAVNSVGNPSELASFMIDGVTDVPPPAPQMTLAAYPNPLNPQTTIRFHLGEAGRATLVVYDVGGRRVRRLFDGSAPSGGQTVTWNGCDDTGRPMSSGNYFVRLDTPQGGLTTKVTLAK